MVSASGKKELDTFAGAAAKKFSLFHKNRTVRESARSENLRKGSESPLPFLYFSCGKVHPSAYSDAVHFARLRHRTKIANVRIAILLKMLARNKTFVHR